MIAFYGYFATLPFVTRKIFIQKLEHAMDEGQLPKPLNLKMMIAPPLILTVVMIPPLTYVFVQKGIDIV